MHKNLVTRNNEYEKCWKIMNFLLYLIILNLLFQIVFSNNDEKTNQLEPLDTPPKKNNQVSFNEPHVSHEENDRQVPLEPPPAPSKEKDRHEPLEPPPAQPKETDHQEPLEPPSTTPQENYLRGPNEPPPAPPVPPEETDQWEPLEPPPAPTKETDHWEPLEPSPAPPEETDQWELLELPPAPPEENDSWELNEPPPAPPEETDHREPNEPPPAPPEETDHREPLEPPPTLPEETDPWKQNEPSPAPPEEIDHWVPLTHHPMLKENDGQTTLETPNNKSEVFENTSDTQQISRKYGYILRQTYVDYEKANFFRPTSTSEGCSLSGSYSCYTSPPKPNERLTVMPCLFDNKCSEYDDCCYDKNSFNLPSEKREITCVGAYSDGNSIGGYFMLTYCHPDFSTLEEEVLCHKTRIEGRETTPVITHDNIVFRNEHCARCNNVTYFKYFLLHYENPIIGAGPFDLNLTTKMELIESGVPFHLLPPHGTYPRVCVQTFVDYNKTDDPACLSFQSPVLMMKNHTPVLYRNIYCSYEMDHEYECFAGYSKQFLDFNTSLKAIVNYNADIYQLQIKDLQNYTESCFLHVLERDNSCTSTVVFYNVQLEYKIHLDVIEVSNPDDPEPIDMLKWECLEILMIETNLLPLPMTVQLKTSTVLDEKCDFEFEYLVLVLEVVEPLHITNDELLYIDEYMTKLKIEFIKTNSKHLPESRLRMSFKQTNCQGLKIDFNRRYLVPHSENFINLKLFGSCYNIKYTFRVVKDIYRGPSIVDSKNVCTHSPSDSNFSGPVYPCFRTSLLSLLMAMLFVKALN